MSPARNSMFSSHSDDDLIEIHAGPVASRPQMMDNLLLPSRRAVYMPFSGTSAAATSRAPRRHNNSPLALPRPHSLHSPVHAQSPGTGLSERAHNRQPPQPEAVIDLTDEPDSPVESRQQPPPPPLQPQSQFQFQSQPQSQSQSQNHSWRNPRRTNSLRASSPPRLARSDGFSHSVIDLTAEPDEDNYQPPARRRRLLPQSYRTRPFPDDQLIELEFINSGSSITSGLASSLGRRLAGLFSGRVFQPPPAGQPVPYDPVRNAFGQREMSPKPGMEPVPPPAEGFTRNTHAASDQEAETVVICPACNDELAYDPSGTVTQSSTSSNGRKRKRAPGEHHFWALKQCGHVYCADCFENRKPTKSAPHGVGFRSHTGVLPFNAPSDVRCAVEDCNTKVANKTEWVGIFL